MVLSVKNSWSQPQDSFLQNSLTVIKFISSNHTEKSCKDIHNQLFVHGQIIKFLNAESEVVIKIWFFFRKIFHHEKLSNLGDMN